VEDENDGAGDEDAGEIDPDIEDKVLMTWMTEKFLGKDSAEWEDRAVRQRGH